MNESPEACNFPWNLQSAKKDSRVKPVFIIKAQSAREVATFPQGILITHHPAVPLASPIPHSLLLSSVKITFLFISLQCQFFLIAFSHLTLLYYFLNARLACLCNISIWRIFFSHSVLISCSCCGMRKGKHDEKSVPIKVMMRKLKFKDQERFAASLAVLHQLFRFWFAFTC